MAMAGHTNRRKKYPPSDIRSQPVFLAPPNFFTASLLTKLNKNLISFDREVSTAPINATRNSLARLCSEAQLRSKISFLPLPSGPPEKPNLDGSTSNSGASISNWRIGPARAVDKYCLPTREKYNPINLVHTDSLRNSDPNLRVEDTSSGINCSNKFLTINKLNELRGDGTKFVCSVS